METKIAVHRIGDLVITTGGQKPSEIQGVYGRNQFYLGLKYQINDRQVNDHPTLECVKCGRPRRHHFICWSDAVKCQIKMFRCEVCDTTRAWGICVGKAPAQKLLIEKTPLTPRHPLSYPETEEKIHEKSGSTDNQYSGSF